MISPPYAKTREQSTRLSQRGKDLFPQQSPGDWRQRNMSTAEIEPDNSKSVQNLGAPAAPVMTIQQDEVNEQRALAKEAIMEELHEVTRQYLSCPDPVEAAARKQRVHFSDTNGLLERTAETILAATTKLPATPRQLQLSDSNPVTPPPINDYPYDYGLLPTIPTLPVDDTSPLGGAEERGGTSVSIGDPPRMQQNLAIAERGGRKMRSIIISPDADRSQTEKANTEQEAQNVPEGEETLQAFQDKIKKRLKNPAKQRSPRVSPNILRGASSKKRNLSQIQNSPGRRVGHSESGPSRKKPMLRKAGNEDTDAPQGRSNPPIHLIPATTRRKADFRLLPHQAP
ncbi:Uncharacterized protein Rs2_31641 [Raphanus sativus]|nr:Uncharacterized protein Rs2_31641 [Raphanus sativus]